ncbi:SRPBCC family protein [Phenylobacterium sp.]|uniref:SRPBCC family protein n=1 Tax=Phenylobacterium sp. TaxID=1871053 RepID=UPI0025FBB086|nr:SRPBCC family protein [Phenylobacterium sp.]
MRRLVLGDVVPLDAAKVWAVIGDFSGMHKWAPIVESESTEVTAKGKVRTLGLRGGRTVVELMVSEGEHHYSYSLDRADMASYVSTVSVVPLADGVCRIELIVDFEPAEGVDQTEATDGFLKFLGGNLKAMKRAAAAA